MRLPIPVGLILAAGTAFGGSLPTNTASYSYITGLMVTYTDRNTYESDHFRIIYSKVDAEAKTDTADGNKNGVPDAVESMADDFEAAWSAYQERGFEMPEFYSGKYEIFLTSPAKAGLGVTIPLGKIPVQKANLGTRQEYSAIVLPAKIISEKARWVNSSDTGFTYSARSATELRRLQKTVITHEFFHAVQYRYWTSADVPQNEWFYEPLAQAAQVKICGIHFDEVWTGMRFLWNLDSRFTENYSAVPKDAWWGQNLRYGRWMLFHYADSRHKGEYLRDLMVLAANSNNAVTAVDSLAKTDGSSLLALLNDFASAYVNRDTASYLNELRIPNKSELESAFSEVGGDRWSLEKTVLRDTLDCSKPSWNSIADGNADSVKLMFRNRNRHLRGNGVDIIELIPGSHASELTLSPAGTVTGTIRLRLCVRRNDTLAVTESVQSETSAPLKISVPAEFDKAWVQVSHSSKASFDMTSGETADPDCAYTISVFETAEPKLSSFSRIFTGSKTGTVQSAAIKSASIQIRGTSGGIQLDNLTRESAKITLCDFSGRVIREIEKPAGSSTAEINTENIGAKAVILRISSKNGSTASLIQTKPQ